MKRSVLVIGAGKVGRALHAALANQGAETWLRPARTLRPQALPSADLVIITSRDDQIEGVARLLAARDDLPRAVLHAAGALDATPLAALASRGVAVGTAHPCLSFASERVRPILDGGALLVTGDRAAVVLAKELARTVGMNVVCPSSLDRALYHAACALTANGSAALAEAASRMLAAAGIAAADQRRLLGPLLRSVARNVAHLAPTEVLTGPVVRGDAATVARHRAAVRRAVPDLETLFAAMIDAQEALVARMTPARARGGARREGAAAKRTQSAARSLQTPKKMRKRGVNSP